MIACMCNSAECRIRGCAQFREFRGVNQTSQPNTNTGWRCPSCQRIYAPFVRSCDCTTGIKIQPTS